MEDLFLPQPNAQRDRPAGPSTMVVGGLKVVRVLKVVE